MKTREQAAANYINEKRKNLNNDSVFTIARSDLYEHWNDAFLAGCEFEAKNRWIPVSERLPETKGDVLCAMLNYKGNRYIQFVGCYTKGHEIEYWDDNDQDDYDEVEEKAGVLFLKPGWYECEETPGGEYDEVWVKREVTHWQPLPSSPPKPQEL